MRNPDASHIQNVHARNNSFSATGHIADAHARNASPEFNPIKPIMGAAKAVVHAAERVGHVIDQASGIHPDNPGQLGPPLPKKRR